MEIKVVKKSKPISRDELKIIVREQFGDLVKAVVDVEQEIMAVGGYHHEDMRELLIEKEGSKFENIWGVDIFPERMGKQYIEIDSIINSKLSFGSRGVYHPKIQKKIISVVEKLVKE